MKPYDPYDDPFKAMFADYLTAMDYHAGYFVFIKDGCTTDAGACSLTPEAAELVTKIGLMVREFIPKSPTSDIMIDTPLKDAAKAVIEAKASWIRSQGIQ